MSELQLSNPEADILYFQFAVSFVDQGIVPVLRILP